MFLKLNLLGIIVFGFLACSHTNAQIPYDLNQPDRKYTLPAVLNEVSGITDLDAEHLALVQDELGLIFIFHLPSGKVLRQLTFDSAGDFEGLTYTGQSLFILRSDGRLTEWKQFNAVTGGKEIIHSNLPLLTADNEGLCYDRKHQRLLIAAKSKPDDSNAKTERYIYAYDLPAHQLARDVEYKLNTIELSADAKQHNISSPPNAKGKSKAFNFRPSSLAIHPCTGLVYVLSASDHLLVVMDEYGNVKYMEKLDPGLFAKAEGITFLSDGTMIISNEANGGVATVLRYEMKKSG